MSEEHRISYGNQQSVRHARLLGMSLAGLAIVAVGVVIWLVMSMFGAGAISFLPLAIGVGLGVTMILTQMLGRTLPEKLMIRRDHRRRVRNGDAYTVAGPLSLAGSARPQGILSEVTWHELVTANNVPFTMLWFESSQTGAVIFSVNSTDKSALDQHAVDVLVGNFAATLANGARLYDPAQICVVTESALGAGAEVQTLAAEQRARLRAVSTVRSPLDKDGVQLAKREHHLEELDASVDALAEMIAQNNPTVRQRIAVSFCPTKRRTEDGKAFADPESVGVAVATAVPDLMASIGASGTWAVEPMGITDIAESVRIAFDPATAAIFDQARSEGDPIRLGWNDAGPASAFAGTRWFEHEDWASATMQMAGPSAQFFREQAMSMLQRPSNAGTTRRITQYFTPLPPEDAADEADKAVRRAANEGNSKLRGVGSTDVHAHTVAGRTAAEIQDKGAVMYRYSMSMTVTCEDPAELKAAKNELSRDARSGVKITLRNTYRQTDTQFMLGLGLGLVPSRIATISDIVREAF